MDTLDRFLIKEFLMFFTTLVIGLAVLFLGVDFFSKFWSFNLPVSKILFIYIYKVPAALQQFVPVAVLMTTLLVLSNMSQQNEILALYSSGIGNFRLLSTLVTVVSMICTVSFLAFDTFVPIFSKKQILITQGLDPSQEQFIHFNRNRFWYRSGTILYNVGRFVSETNTLEDINIYCLDSDFHVSKTIRAKKATFTDNDWVLENGFSVRYDTKNHYPVSEVFSGKTGVIPEKPGDFKTLKVVEETMRLKDLRRYITRNRGYGLDTTHQEVHYHERISMIFTPLIFVLLAIPFAIKPLRTQSIPRSIGFCFLAVFTYLLLLRMTLSLGKGGEIPPILAGWSTNVLYLSYSVFAMFKRQ